MTNHPLTEEMMGKIHGDEPGYSNPYDEDDMRAAYDLGRDDQLAEALAWVEYEFLGGKDHAEDMKNDLRPTKTQEDK